ncbi:MAG: helix-turn-helix domain-containing protein, partial [Clostridiales bacterium]|nr:helix-turn-helix domain-containing protein [Clostridiales bacterium]
MELITQINKALKYIEENIKNDIDYSIICKICCCSLPKIQQIFLFTCGISISEYIRKRRMTVAAHEIMNTKVKVVDLALKLGYNSPESFTRAYKLFHDVTPTDTRNKKSYKEYFPISKQLQVYGGDNKLGNEPIVLIETERLKIRKFKSDDWKDLLDIAISKENSQFDSRDHKWPTDEVGIKNACEYFAKENQFWAVEVKDLEKVICFVNFNYIDENRKLDI